jgi:hypothetical protein
MPELQEVAVKLCQESSPFWCIPYRGPSQFLFCHYSNRIERPLCTDGLHFWVKSCVAAPPRQATKVQKSIHLTGKAIWRISIDVRLPTIRSMLPPFPHYAFWAAWRGTVPSAFIKMQAVKFHPSYHWTSLAWPKRTGRATGCYCYPKSGGTVPCQQISLVL